MNVERNYTSIREVRGTELRVAKIYFPRRKAADQVKSLDWRVRKAKRKGAVSAEELAEVRAKMVALIG
jgi:mRNA-degrading endonuclease toxin of MazEF toxin-antitoxin module